MARERIDRFRIYLEAVEQHDVRDIETGVRSFIAGAAPGVNPNFLPPPPAVASEVRRVMNLRLESEARSRKPALPPPMVEKSPESRERVKAMVGNLVGRMAEQARTEDAAKDVRRKGRAARLAARFDPPIDGTMERLMGYSIGSPESEEESA